MLFRKLTLVLALWVIAQSAVAQKLSTGNNFVSATVDVNSGLVSVTQGTTFLTYPGTSYLSVKIDGRFYTNNSASAPTSLADPLGTGTTSHSPDVFLDSGTTTQIGDHIKTVWHDSTNNLDIIQTVYPVQFGASGQIVISVSVVSAQQHIIQGQYLVDDETGVQANPVILNSNGYDAHNFSLHSGNMPSFYLEMQNSPTNPGTIGMIYLNDTFAPAPMGLIPANALYHIDWDVVSDYTFGAPIQNGTTSDMGSLIQWPTLNTKAGTAEILRFSIGTSEAQQCSGNVTAYNFFPSHIAWNDTTETDSPNPFNVLSLVYNPSQFGYSQFTLWQDPDAPITGGSAKAIGPVAGSSAITFKWTDTMGQLSGCSGGTTTKKIRLSATASGQAPDPNLDCLVTLTIDCPPVKTHRPQVITRSTTGSSDGSECNARTITKVTRDTGSPRMFLKSVQQIASTNMKVAVTPFTLADSVSYTVTVIDTMLDGIAIVAITDTGNVTTRDTTRYCTIHDTTKPTAILVERPDHWELGFSDTGAWQRGIDSLFITDSANIFIMLSSGVKGCKPTLEIYAKPITANIAHALVHVVDCAGNELKYALFISPNGDVSQNAALSRIRVFPNPSTDAFTLELPNEPTRVEIIDALGRTVASFTGHSEVTFDATALAAGTYFLHAANTYQHLIKQ